MKVFKNTVFENNSMETYATLRELRPDINSKRLDIIKKVANVDSSNIKEYVITMQDIQKELKNIILNDKHYETKPAAHMNGLLEKLSEDQTKKVEYYRL